MVYQQCDHTWDWWPQPNSRGHRYRPCWPRLGESSLPSGRHLSALRWRRRTAFLTWSRATSSAHTPSPPWPARRSGGDWSQIWSPPFRYTCFNLKTGPLAVSDFWPFLKRWLSSSTVFYDMAKSDLSWANSFSSSDIVAKFRESQEGTEENNVFLPDKSRTFILKSK